MTEYSTHEIVSKLIGNIEPWGDTNIDKRRLDNLDDFGDLIQSLCSDVIDVTKFINRPEESINEIAEKGIEILKDLKHDIDKALEEVEP